MKVLTHGGVGHADDFLACCLLIAKYPDAVIIRASSHTEVEADIYVDIGGKLEPPRFLDHHHDSSVPSSFILVLKHFFDVADEDLDYTDIKFYDYRDRFGVKKACEILQIASDVPPLVEDLLLNLWSRAKEVRPNDALHQIMRMIGEEFIEMLKRRREGRKMIENAERIRTEHGTVVFVDSPTIPIPLIKHVVPDVIGVVRPNSRNQNHTDIIRVDDNPYFDPAKVAEGLPTVFKHATGFLVVINLPFEQAKEVIKSKI